MSVSPFPRPVESSPGDLRDPACYINRELSWLEFNQRVLDQATSDYHPLLERVKFLASVASNLDEFYMVAKRHGLADVRVSRGRHPAEPWRPVPGR